MHSECKVIQNSYSKLKAALQECQNAFRARSGITVEAIAEIISRPPWRWNGSGSTHFDKVAMLVS
jgi:hypothetical protein